MYLGQTRQRDEPTTATHQREADKQKDPFFFNSFFEQRNKTSDKLDQGALGMSDP